MSGRVLTPTAIWATEATALSEQMLEELRLLVRCVEHYQTLLDCSDICGLYEHTFLNLHRDKIVGLVAKYQPLVQAVLGKEVAIRTAEDDGTLTLQ